MAYLLGGKACMGSLRNDVQDIHWSVADIVSRSGPIELPSWKFPDKTSSHLDIDELLELYDYSDGDKEDNQVAHIGLYELVIDRLVYLLQAMSKYTEQLLDNIKSSGDNSTSMSSSVGLVVKKYCGRLIHLHTIIQQTQSENKSKTRKITDLEKIVQKIYSENGVLNDTKQGTHSYSSLSDIELNGIGSPIQDISKDACNKSSQTIETAFIPCESCEVVQKNLRETGDIIVHVCATQGLPSSLKKFRPQVAGYDWLSANDITRWTHEQNKDLSRINKFVDQLSLEVNPMKAEVTAFEKETKQMEHKVRQIENELKLEKDTQSAIKRQFEIKLQERENTHSENMASVNRQKEEVIATRKAVEQELENSRGELRKHQSELENLEITLKGLERELRKAKLEEEDMKRLDTKVKDLNIQLHDVTDKLELQTKEYNMEVSKNKSSQKRNETLQAKQSSLLERIDQLDRENEEIKDQMNEIEEEKENIKEKLDKLQEENGQLHQQSQENKMKVEKLIAEKNKLETNMEETKELITKLEVQVNEAREREQLLIEYPDLNGPVNPDYKGTGNIVMDMENQVKANLIRVQILEKQSEGLQNSIYKFVSSQGQGHSSKLSSQSTVNSTKTVIDGPTQLWKMDDLYDDKSAKSFRYSNSNQNNSNSADISPPKSSQNTSPPKSNQNILLPASNQQGSPPRSKPRVKANLFTINFDSSSTKTKEEFVVSQSKRPESAKKGKDNSRQGRPLSSKMSTMAPVNQTSIGAYLQMKKSGHLNTPNRPSSGKPEKVNNQSNREDNSDYSPSNVYVCPNCDKMYQKERDLEIHHLYCSQHT